MVVRAFDRIEWHAGSPPAVLRGAVLPLAIGIHEDLIKRAKSPEGDVRRALRSYTTMKPYIAALLADQAMRYDADGNPTEPVNEGAKVAAAALMNYRLASPKPPATAGNETTGVSALKPEPVKPVRKSVETAVKRMLPDRPKLTLEGRSTSRSGVCVGGAHMKPESGEA